MNNQYRTLLLIFVMGVFHQVDAQTYLIVKSHAMPSVFISTELTYFQYFGDQKVQPLFQAGGMIGLEINNRWMLLTGFIFHERKMSADCMYMPYSGGPYPAQSLLPWISKTICTHTAERDYRIVEFPFLAGYKFRSRHKITPYTMLGFSPFKKVSYTETRQKIDDGQLVTNSQSYGSELGYLFFSYLSFGADYKLSPKFDFTSEIVYRVDDKTFRDHTVGISLGVQYRFLLKK